MISADSGVNLGMVKVAVFGSGSFGTALATVVARNGHDVVMLTRSEEVVTSVNTLHKNCFYLQDFTLPDSLTATTDCVAALKDASYIIHGVPVQASTEYLKTRAHLIPADVPIISASKGLHTQTLQLMSELIPAALGRDQPTAYFSGPSFAKELMEAQPTGVVIASAQRELAVRVQTLFSSSVLRTYVSTDVIGVEVGGALKNVFAIAAGCAKGLGFGQNTMALLVTRGLAEQNKLACAMGSDPHTLSGLAGIGDLMLTCMGSLSRNQSVGIRLGQGETVEEIRASMKEVAEGVATAPAAVALANKYGLDCPIMRAVDGVLAGTIAPRAAVEQLMAMPLVEER